VIVETEKLTVVYRRRWRSRTLTALDRVNLAVREGDFFALIGPNGAGKSTALYCMLGLLRPDSGEARVFGRRLRPGCTEFRDIAYLPEEPHYHDYLTVEEAVVYYARLAGLDSTAHQIREVLERLDIGDVRSMPISACSKGMKQKVGIAHCLLHQPRLLFLDEPMRGLDPIATKDFRDALVDLNRRGVTIVMNSHLLSEVELVANRVAILANGRVAAVEDVGTLVGRDTDRGRRTLEDAFMAIVRKDTNAHA